MMDRRLFLSSAASLGLLAGCNKSSAARSNVALIGEDSSNLQAIARYLKRHAPGLDFSTTVDATDFVSASSKAMTAFTRKSGAYDLVLGYNFDLPRYVNNHYLLSVEELKKQASPNTSFAFEADLLPNVWKELGYAQSSPGATEIFAYPSSANTMILVYNEGIFDDPKIDSAYRAKFGRAFSPPKTWEELAAVALLVPQANPKFRGIALQGAEGGWLYYEWMNFLFGMGGKTMEKAYGWQSTVETPLTLRTVEAARAAQLYLSLKPASAGDFLTMDSVKQRDAMLSREVAFAIAWTDYVPDLAKVGGFGFAPIPGSVSMIAGGSFFLNRYSDAKRESADLVAHLLSAKTQKELALDGLFPPSRSALNDQDVLKKPYMPAVKTSIERGTYMLEAGVDSSLISEKITQALQEAWRGEITAEAVGARASKLIEDQRKAL